MYEKGFLDRCCLWDIWIQREWIWIGREQIWERKRNIGKNLQNPTHRRIVFCYVSRIFAYFILTHIDLYFIFSHRVLVIIVPHRAHEDAHLIRLNFVSCPWQFLLFCCNAQADYFISILSLKKLCFHLASLTICLFCFNARKVKLYFIVSHRLLLVFYFQSH